MAEQVVSAQQQFVDPYQYVETGGRLSMSTADHIGDFFTGGASRERIDARKAQYEQELERQRTNSARAYEEWFDSTAVQRRVKDIEKAGLNPWLALQSGGINSNGSSSVTSSSAKASSSSKDGGDISDITRLLGTALLVLKMFL